MGIIAKLLGKAPQEETSRVGGMEDFMTLIRVYYQAVMAMQMGISNLAVLPDLRIFKQTLHVPTVNNKLGIGERKTLPHHADGCLRHGRKTFSRR